MLTTDAGRLAAATIPVGTGWLLGACMEARGKQDLWMRRNPEVLAVLREQAIVQSVESSNRIEGVSVPPVRLRPVALGRVRPRDRSEEDLAGYRRALNWAFSRRASVTITPDVVRRLNALAQGGHSGDAGEWKRSDNKIIEILPDGRRRIRFTPTPARDTARTMETLCRAYREACADERVPPLLIIAAFVFDLLCIHPFRDGNGRVSRLATTLLLQSHGFQVARYVSLERLIEDRKDEYYDVLQACSVGWHEGGNEIVPWWNLFLGVLRAGYREFEHQVESAGAHPVKSDLVRRAVLDQTEPFRLGDLTSCLPTASPQLVKKVLAELKREGRVRLTGRGRGASWEVVP